MEVMDSGEGTSHNVQVTVCLPMDTHNYTEPHVKLIT